ncbi:MAG: hypothetical protein BIP78_1155 [Candidatus Bipolaricaulis sibiricus]|uniref:PrcB C-terminal domain-containing protein n=1 Tax=Bipolaricaulis sibiricus TaxID=2501609 RepID=A0A410FVE5_BIPS1|nr:MAG: hypothetical protein BIP78_1155 [Candidatus Bipolaricaulis sibiricus]
MRAKTGVAVLFLGPVSLLAGCLPRTDPGCPTCPGGGAAVRVELSFETVDQGTSSGIRDPRQVVVRDAETWAALWYQHTTGADPRPPVPGVDFTEEIVAAVFLGEKPTGGYAVEITRILLRSDRMVVRAGLSQPGADDVVSQALTHPFHIVRVTRTELPVEFETLEF